MNNVNEIRLTIYQYILYEEEFLRHLEKEQDGYSDEAHVMEEEANADYSKRLAYINSVQEMRRYRAGVIAHHTYTDLLRVRYMEMDNKINMENT